MPRCSFALARAEVYRGLLCNSFVLSLFFHPAFGRGRAGESSSAMCLKLLFALASRPALHRRGKGEYVTASNHIVAPSPRKHDPLPVALDRPAVLRAELLAFLRPSIFIALENHRSKPRSLNARHQILQGVRGRVEVNGVQL